jgi:hypothetical protein
MTRGGRRRSLLGFAEFLWMDGCGGRRRQRQFIDKHLGQKGDANGARSGLGRLAQAGRPRPISARFGPGFLPGCFSRDSLFVCTCMWAFDVVSFTVKAWILAKLRCFLVDSLKTCTLTLRSSGHLESCSSRVLTCDGLHDLLLKCLMNLSWKSTL